MRKKKDYLINNKNNNLIIKKQTILQNENFKDETIANSKYILGNILKALREQKFNLLLSVFQEFIEYDIKDNILEITFIDNFKEVLLKQQNIDIINNILRKYNLKIGFKFIESTKDVDIENILKQKFKKINIKE